MTYIIIIAFALTVCALDTSARMFYPILIVCSIFLLPFLYPFDKITKWFFKLKYAGIFLYALIVLFCIGVQETMLLIPIMFISYTDDKTKEVMYPI